MATILYILIIYGLVVMIRIFIQFVSRLPWKKPKLVYTQQHMDAKSAYLQLFRGIPSLTYLYGADVKLVFDHINSIYKERLRTVYQTCHFNREEDRQEFTKTIFVMNNSVVVELAGTYMEIVFSNRQRKFVDSLIHELKAYRQPDKVEDFEINIITFAQGGLELRSLDITPTKLDIGLYYNDDFSEVDELIRRRLNMEKDKGLVLLHGLPGTGKTTYLRYLIGTLKKRVLFVSPSVAANLMNPELIDVLLANPNSVLIIEDAENILMDRKVNENGAVSNLLNLTDGLLGDCLNVQIICTFNNALSMIDPALMRKGRLIARYEFGKLVAQKATALSRHLGYERTYDRPATIAEIANQGDREFEVKTEIIGFRRSELTQVQN